MRSDALPAQGAAVLANRKGVAHFLLIPTPTIIGIESPKAKEVMLQRSHIPEAPWWVVQAVDKKRARLELHRSPAQAVSLYGSAQGAGPAARARAPRALFAPGSAGRDAGARGLLVFSLATLAGTAATTTVPSASCKTAPSATASRLDGLIPQVHPRRRVVARPLPAADVAVDAGSGHASRDGRVQQQVVDAEPRVATIRVAEEVPERVDPLVRVQVADRVGPPLGEQPAVRLARLRTRNRASASQPAGLVDVELFRDHVVVAGQDDRLGQ